MRSLINQVDEGDQVQNISQRFGLSRWELKNILFVECFSALLANYRVTRLGSNSLNEYLNNHFKS